MESDVGSHCGDPYRKEDKNEEDKDVGLQSGEGFALDAWR